VFVAEFLGRKDLELRSGQLAVIVGNHRHGGQGPSCTLTWNRDMGDLRADIISTLGLSAPDELKLVEECRLQGLPREYGCSDASTGMEVCRVYNISPQDVLFKWEAIKFNSRTNALSELQMPFNMSSIEAIKQELNRNMAAAAKAAAPRQNKRGALVQRGSRIPPMARQTLQKAARVEQDAGPSSVDVVVSNIVKPCIPILANSGSISHPFSDRYMFEKISERSESMSCLTVAM
jgi:hypothetical protein